MIKYILTFSFICFYLISEGQNETDAIRYSTMKPIGTARYTAMGGAFSALGGDMTGIAYNPAGLGIYRRSDVSISSAWTQTNTTSNYNGTKLDGEVFNMSLGNIGFVAANPLANNSDWKMVNFSFAYNQLANFNRNVNINGRNRESSGLDSETEYLNQNPNDYQNNPYYGANVVFYDSSNSNGWGYFNDYNFNGENYGANVQNIIRSSGYAGEYDFSLAANYRDYLYFGATFGIVHIDYTETNTYSEIPFDDSIALKYYESVSTFNTTGNGYNFKIGMMMKLGHLIRVGAAFHTPTSFNLNDNYYTDVSSTIVLNDDIEYAQAKSPAGNYAWDYKSPMRLIGSAAVVVGRLAILSAEMEFIDYGSMNLSAGDYSFIDENENINSYFSWAANAKAGAEIRTGILSWRLGFAFYESPYKLEYENSDANTFQYSGGLGIKTSGLFFDAAYSYSTQNEKYYMHDGSDTEVDIKNTRGSFNATLGYRF